MTALRIGDQPLSPAAVVRAARAGRVDVEISQAARERMAEGHRAAEEAATRRPVYGRTTGVGANRGVAVEDDPAAHAMRLLRSHAGGAGDPLPDEMVRATILIRLSQMAAGGGGQRPAIADALAARLRDDRLPVLRDLGGIGTGDLTVLAQLGLEIAGDGDPVDALPIMSSNAATLAAAALAWADLSELLAAGLGVAAVTFRAMDGNREAFAPQLAAARPLPGLAAVSAPLWALTADAPDPARIQDPFGLRCIPQVGAALHGALGGLHDVLAIDVNAATENPLVAGGEVIHHGGFHAASCALALDAVRLAIVPFGALALARLSHLMSPPLTGLTPFLSAGAPGSSGLLIAEYLAADALARLRADAAPTVGGAVTISQGLEEHASFAWQGALQARRAVGRLRTVLALEWVAAERALRMKEVPAEGVLAPLRALAEAFDADLEDRPIGADVAAAEASLPALAELVRASDAT
jgi:histidine ammonia-lyase